MKGLLKKLLARSPRQARARGCEIQALEDRVLFTTGHVTSVVADNRGLVVLNFDQALRAITVDKKAVEILTAGQDGHLGTADDVRVRETLSYSSSRKRIIIDAKLQHDTPYRVLLMSTRLRTTTHSDLDGRFNGANVISGNNSGQSDFDIKCTPVQGDVVARFSTTAGTLRVSLFESNNAVKATVDNFLLYTNAGVYDSTCFHRKATVANDTVNVLQGGGIKINSNDTLGAEPQAQPINLQAVLNNDQGTIAMARAPGPNTATNQFFFNYTANAGLNGNYAVFGQVQGGDQATLTRMSQKETVSVHGDPNIPANIADAMSPENPPSSGQFPATVPVMNKATYQARGHLDPMVDLIRIFRVAIDMGLTRTH